jgi:apolipoprotein N-acyltransferase
MNILKNSPPPFLSWPKALFWVITAVVCFHVAYEGYHFGLPGFFTLGYVVSLTQLGGLPTTRQSFYTGLVTGVLCVGPQLDCFWRIFGPAAIPLWLILSFWIALFVTLVRLTLVNLGRYWTALLIPFLWTGLEYFRSEVYYLKFSWLNIGYAFAYCPRVPFALIGMYGVGFVAALSSAIFMLLRWFYALPATAALVVALSLLRPESRTAEGQTLHVAGIQMEFPSEREIPIALHDVLKRYPDTELVVLSEYTLDGPVPESLKAWCRDNHRYLIVGGKDPAPNGNYYDSAFVVGPTGVVFRQVKSVPIQFFKDGLPATEQKVWQSPWGRIGICICYDLSYTRVTDRLIADGAQLLIVPTMDVVDWGKRQHEMHGLVAPIRAAEYGIPIFRVASSGISQAVDRDGRVLAQDKYSGREGNSFCRIPAVQQRLTAVG